MDQLMAGRVLMGDSLGFHIIFALLGVGLPVVVAILEFMALRRGDSELRKSAKFWSYVSGILVITGVLSGTVVALQMFLVWPGILQFGGKAIALAFAWEGYAFILEAIFLGFYLKTWDKLKGWAHWALLWPVIIGASLSGFLITSVDAWMNHPSGIAVANGQVISADPVGAIFTQTTYLQASHSILSYYLTAILLAAAVFAWRLLRGTATGKAAAAARLAAGRLGVIALVLLGGIVVLGDLSAKYLATNEPVKLAAIEQLATSAAHAPFRFGEWEVPGLLSWLVGGSTGTFVRGLDAVPSDQLPPLYIHTLFDIKLILIVLLSCAVVGFAGLYLAKSHRAFTKPWLWLVVAAPLVSVSVIELGWMVTEIGRQPYAVMGYVTTSEAITTSPGVLALGWLFPAAYVVLAAVTTYAIRRLVAAQKGGAK